MLGFSGCVIRTFAFAVQHGRWGEHLLVRMVCFAEIIQLVRLYSFFVDC